MKKLTIIINLLIFAVIIFNYFFSQYYFNSELMTGSAAFAAVWNLFYILKTDKELLDSKKSGE